MAERVLEDKNCLKCGADFRPGALFCYSCGSQVEENLNGRENTPEEKDDFQEKYQTNPLKKLGAIEKPVGTPLDAVAVEPVEKQANNPEKKLVVQKETNLKTAASLRKRNKPKENNPVEIIWEAPENSSHTWFVLVSLILVLFAVIMLMAMLYLR